jgi:hypothetical protein
VHHAPGSVRARNPPFGLLPDRVIYVEARDEPSVLACLEEDCGMAVSALWSARLQVLMTASRRFQLDAEGSGVAGVAIRVGAEGAHRRLRTADRLSPAGASALSPQPHCRWRALGVRGAALNWSVAVAENVLF